MEQLSQTVLWAIPRKQWLSALPKGLVTYLCGQLYLLLASREKPRKGQAKGGFNVCFILFGFCLLFWSWHKRKHSAWKIMYTNVLNKWAQCFSTDYNHILLQIFYFTLHYRHVIRYRYVESAKKWNFLARVGELNKMSWYIYFKGHMCCWNLLPSTQGERLPLNVSKGLTQQLTSPVTTGVWLFAVDTSVFMVKQ